MFKVGHVYTHKNMLDVCMFVIRIMLLDTGIELDVRWFKRNGLDLNAEDTIQLNEEDLERWYEYAREN